MSAETFLNQPAVCVCVCVCGGGMGGEGGYTCLSRCAHVSYTVQFDVRAKSGL